jgi:hypothetical protein
VSSCATPVDLASIVQDSIEAARPAGADKGIVLTLSLPAYRS